MEHQEINKVFSKWQGITLVAGIIGLAGAGYGFVTERELFYHSWLMGFIYWFAIACGSLALLLIHHLVAGRWGFMIQRALEAAAKTIPLLALFFIPIVLGMTNLYEWARPEALHDEVLMSKRLYLNPNGFLIRAGVYFVLTSILAYRLAGLSNKVDAGVDPEANHRRLLTMSGPGLVAYVLSLSMVAIDWGMSLTPHWFSTMYAPLWLAAQGISTFSFMAIIGHMMGHRKPVSHYMNHQHFHDIGNMMFAFTILYTYMSLGEYIIVWSGNLSEETEWFLDRSGNWHWVALILGVLMFALPFLVLLNKPVKRHSRILSKIAVWVLAMRYIGVFWMIAPTFRHEPRLHWIDLATWAGIGGIWLSAFFGLLKRRPLLPVGDPRFQEKFHAHPEVH